MPTALFSQSGYNVAQTLDGNLATVNNGWGSFPNRLGLPNTAVWETTPDAPTFPGGTTVELTLIQRYFSDHNLGCMIFSVTDADRSLFADGALSNGQLGDPAIWTPLPITDTSSTNGTVFNVDGAASGQIVAIDANFNGDDYVFTGVTPLENVTGIRLDMCNSALIPTGGPGLAGNQNYVLTEFEVALGGI